MTASALLFHTDLIPRADSWGGEEGIFRNESEVIAPRASHINSAVREHLFL